jgi:hypothetical protein
MVDHADPERPDAVVRECRVVGYGRAALARSRGSWPASICRVSVRTPPVQAIEPKWSKGHRGAAEEAVGRLDAGDAAQNREAADRALGMDADAVQDRPRAMVRGI